MHFEITASQQTIRKPLTTAQRNSSLFAEAPRLAGKTLRRGQVLRMSAAEFKANEVMAKRLFDAGSIEIVMVDGDHREDFRKKEQDWKAKEAAPKEEVKKEAPPLPPAPVQVNVEPTPAPTPEVPPETVPEAPGSPVEEVQAEKAPSEEPTSATVPESRGKRGRR
jgi:hypothetical protein